MVRYKAKRLPSLVERINGLGYGLTMGIHTRIDETMQDIASAARIGNIYVNRNQIGAVVGVQPFGGEGLSGTGPKAGGPHYLEAMQKRSFGTGAAPLPVDGGNLTTDDQTAVSAAHAAYDEWRLSGADRAAVFMAASKQADERTKTILERATALYATHFKEPKTLPGPTGESNTLRLRGRGVVAVLGGGRPSTIDNQMSMALAAGNALICPEELAGAMSEALEAAGAPKRLVSALTGSNGVNSGLLRHDAVRGVAADGPAGSRAAIVDVLSTRRGPIIPLLSGDDAPWRYAVERALCINTTAAGGDVRLLSLSE